MKSLIAPNTLILLLACLCNPFNCRAQTTAGGPGNKLGVVVNPWDHIFRKWESDKSKLDANHIDSKDRNTANSKLLTDAIKLECMRHSDKDLLDGLQMISDDKLRYAAVQALVIVFIDSGNRNALVRLVANWCPRRVLTTDIEFWLAYQSRKTIKDGVAVLWEAYAISNNQAAKKEIANALKRGFLALGVVGSRDAEIVSKCRLLYTSHRSSLVPNIDYSDNAMHPRGNPGIEDPYAKTGLFVFKSKKRD